MNRFTLILLFAFPGLLCAGLFPRKSLEPPVAKTIVAYSNGIYVDLRVSRSAFLDFLTRARYSAVLPPEIIKRRDQNDLGWFTGDTKAGGDKERTELFLRLEGVFSDSKDRIFYWELPDPRVLVFVSENGEGGYFWVGANEAPMHTESKSAISSGDQNGPNQALVSTPASVTPAADAPVAPDAGAAHR